SSLDRGSKFARCVHLPRSGSGRLPRPDPSLVRPLLLPPSLYESVPDGGPMSSRGFEELWRRAFEFNVRYSSSLGKLTVEYLSDLAGAMSAHTAARTDAPQAAQPGPQPAYAPAA